MRKAQGAKEGTHEIARACGAAQAAINDEKEANGPTDIAPRIVSSSVTVLSSENQHSSRRKPLPKCSAIVPHLFSRWEGDGMQAIEAHTSRSIVSHI